MSWTVLVAEYLIIGIQTLVWLLLFLKSMRPDVYEHLLAVKSTIPIGNNSLIVILAFVLAYPLGMLCDYVWNILTQWILKGRTKKLWKELNSSSSQVGAEFYKAEDSIYVVNDGQLQRLMRRRGRIRILRASMYNLAFTAIALLLLVNKWHLLIGISSIIMEVILILIFREIHLEYVRMIFRQYRDKVLIPLQKTTQVCAPQ